MLIQLSLNSFSMIYETVSSVPYLLQPPAEQLARPPCAVPLVLVDVGRVKQHLDLAELAHDLLLLLEEHLAARQLRMDGAPVQLQRGESGR